MPEKIFLSPLGKTWILDLDGTIVKHNGYLLDGEDQFLPGAQEFLQSISDNDMIIFVTSREQTFLPQTEAFLRAHGIRWNAMIGNAPYGERIVINDAKPSGLQTAIAINTQRDQFTSVSFEIDETL